MRLIVSRNFWRNTCSEAHGGGRGQLEQSPQPVAGHPTSPLTGFLPPMAAPINGRINGWPVWIMIDLVTFGYTTGLLDCCPYGQSDVVPNEIWEACNRIFNACEGLGPEAALRKAKELGFVPD
jgi:hypothetical protein